MTKKLELLKQDQLETWPLFKSNHAALKNLKRKTIPLVGVNVIAQFNPGRITSTSAKVDKSSINNRVCFLCESNLPDEQQGEKFENNYTFLCNPFPIFDNHFTIPHNKHIPQNIEEHFSTMINLATACKEEFAIFYNGPACGASAPDHFHFQAIPQNELPLVLEIKKNFEKLTGPNKEREGIYGITQYAMNFVLISGINKSQINKLWNSFYANYLRMDRLETEPMFNLVLYFSENMYNLIIFPRKQHRPKEYYYEGDERLLVSPASIDLAGVIILPRLDDYNRINETIVKDIYEQVLVGDDQINKLVNF